MANLTVTILVRTTRAGKRVWLPALRDSGPASYYVRWCEGSRPRFMKAGNPFEEAEVARLRLERKLKAASQNLLVPEELKSNPTTHRITDVIAAYLADQAKPDANGNFKSKKSINSKKSELNKFAAFCGKTYVEEINKHVLIAFRDHLNAEGYEPDTVYNKLMDVITWLKHNGVVPYKPLLEKKDWPEKKETNPDPYTDAEITAMMEAAADDDERLLIAFFAGTGMREGEVSVAERGDLDEASHGIYVRRAKPEYGWRAKNKAAARFISIDDDLLNVLAKRGPGLLFPRNGRPNGHLLRIVERLAEQAKVTPTTAKTSTHRNAVKDDWCHRFRDTWLTDRVEHAEDVNALRDICKQAGHSNMETLDVYAQRRKANDPRTRAAANRNSRFSRRINITKKEKVIAIA